MSQNLSSAAAVIGALRIKHLHAWQLCMLLLSSADFFKSKFFSKFFQEHFQNVRVRQFGSRSGLTDVRYMHLLSDQAQCFVSPDLGANYLQRLSADDKSHSIRKELKQDKTCWFAASSIGTAKKFSVKL